MLLYYYCWRCRRWYGSPSGKLVATMLCRRCKREARKAAQ